jgi:UPF0716 protein FxsA
MAPWLLLTILLGFPLLELWVAVLVAQKIGWWLLLWLIGSVVIGINLIRKQQFAMLGQVMRAVQQGQDPFQAIFASGRILLAGLLFIFPGVVSDGLALLLLIWPRRRAPVPIDSDVIEGEFRREDSIKLPKD